MSSASKEYIANELVSELAGIHYPIWHRILPPDCHLKIPLPSFLKEPISQLLNFDLAETIEDCLPYSRIDWSDRCTNWLASNFNGTTFQLNRRIRDALARNIYQSTASPALLLILTTPISSISFQTESLSRYTNPLDKRTLGAYQNACTTIFKKYGAPSNLCQLLSSNDFAVSETQHHQIAEYFMKMIAAAKQADDFIAHHNWIARYILMLLIVATGHRKSLAPFFFPWDILIEENLAFLCDKLTVGSEARFVPIPRWITELILDYRKHLCMLSDLFSSSAPYLSRQIRHLAAGGDLHALHESQEETAMDPHHRSVGLSFFFRIDRKSNGELIAKTLTTADLEKCYSTVYSGKIGEFRKSAANSLWSSRHSGHQVEAFLGHNAEMHSFGGSSAWSVIGWANEIRAWQEEYLELRGWKRIRWLSSSAQHLKLAQEAPLLNTCASSYEGRGRDNQQSLATAIKIIRENLPPVWFLDESSTITEKDVIQLKEIVKSKLQGDPESVAKVNQALALEIDRIRKCIGKVSSTISNLTRTEPCPIAIYASRHYAIAARIRMWCHKQVGKYPMGASDDAAIDRLAEIGISLIIFDAVLDQTTWTNLLEEIALQGTTKAHGCLNVRTRIEKPDRIYDKGLVLSPNTSALILGLNFKHSSFIPSEAIIKDVTHCFVDAHVKLRLLLPAIFRRWQCAERMYGRERCSVT